MKIGFVVNSIETELASYTTTRLAMAAVNRGHEAWLIGTGDLALDPDDRVRARARSAPRKSYKVLANYLEEVRGPRARAERITVDDLDVLMLRNDPAEDIGRRGWAQMAGIMFGRAALRRDRYERRVPIATEVSRRRNGGDVVGPVRIAAGVREVVVAAQQQAGVRDHHQRFDRLARHPERITEADVAGVDRRQGDAVRVGDRGQVDHRYLRHGAVGASASEIDGVHTAVDRREATAAVALHDQQAMVVERLRVGDEVARALDAVVGEAGEVVRQVKGVW